MFLTTTNLVHYLVARGTIGLEAVVDASVRIVAFDRRNCNFKVFLGEAPGLFVKQMPTLVEGTGGGLSREAACHQLARSRPESAPLADLMPRLRDYDYDRLTLSVELLHPGEDLRELHDRLGHIPEPLAKALGRALGRLHALGPTLARHPEDLTAFPRFRPWVLDAISDAEALAGEMNSGQREFLAIVHRSPELAYGIDGLRRAWQPAALIHGDLKRDNIMVLPGGDQGPLVRFIDWELADFGDPAWDVAGLFATCLEPRLLQDVAAEGPEPLTFEDAWPAIAALWQAYAEALGLPQAGRQAYRNRCVHYLGAKLLLLGFELLATWSEPAPTIRRIEKLTRSIMVDPAWAGEDLLGLGQTLPPS